MSRTISTSLQPRSIRPHDAAQPFGILARPILAAALALTAVCAAIAQHPSEPSAASDTVLIELADESIVESSGLAISRRKPNRYWTHNDSGDQPRLFAFDESGRATGQCRLPLATSIDWEDMASFVQPATANNRSVPRLVVADCGNNDFKRESIAVYFFDEPDPDAVTQIDHFTKLELRYADGPQDCEAIAVDARRGELVLLSKSFLPFAGLYRTPLVQREHSAVVHQQRVVTRSRTLALPLVTAMDIDDNGDIWAGTYFDLFCFRCTDRTQPIDEQLGSLPEHFAMPRLRQIEALCVDTEHHIHVTTEGKPAQMTRALIGNRPQTP